MSGYTFVVSRITYAPRLGKYIISSYSYLGGSTVSSVLQYRSTGYSSSGCASACPCAAEQQEGQLGLDGRFFILRFLASSLAYARTPERGQMRSGCIEDVKLQSRIAPKPRIEPRFRSALNFVFLLEIIRHHFQITVCVPCGCRVAGTLEKGGEAKRRARVDATDRPTVTSSGPGRGPYPLQPPSCWGSARSRVASGSERASHCAWPQLAVKSASVPHPRIRAGQGSP